MQGGKRILVIDDVRMVREMIAGILSNGGYAVITARNGVDGLATLESQSVDILVTDILMPEGEGIETIFNVRKAYPEVKIVAVSGGFLTGKFEILRIARECGAHATLAKPFEPEELLSAVAEVDELSRGQGAGRRHGAKDVPPPEPPGSGGQLPNTPVAAAKRGRSPSRR